MPETDIQVQRKGLWLGMTLLFKVQSVLVKVSPADFNRFKLNKIKLNVYLDAPMSLDSISIYNQYLLH